MLKTIITHRKVIKTFLFDVLTEVKKSQAQLLYAGSLTCYFQGLSLWCAIYNLSQRDRQWQEKQCRIIKVDAVTFTDQAVFPWALLTNNLNKGKTWRPSETTSNTFTLKRHTRW